MTFTATDAYAQSLAASPILVATKRELASLPRDAFTIKAGRQRRTLGAFGRDLVHAMKQVEPGLWARERRERAAAAEKRIAVIMRERGLPREAFAWRIAA